MASPTPSIRGEVDWWWRYVELEKVKYDDMMIRFWVPLEPENFWEDLHFLRDDDELE